MIAVTSTRTSPGVLPPLREASGLAAGMVYVVDDQQSQLPDKVKAVLETAESGRLEVLTQAAAGQGVTAPGTYLNADDYTSLAGQTNPTLRRYRRRDTFAKLSSAAGVLVLLTTLLAVLTAAVSTFFVWSAASSPAATTVNDRAQALIQWVNDPRAAGDAQSRAAQAEACLSEIRDQTEVDVTVANISCASVKTPWWRQSTVGSLITGAIGLLTTLLGALTLNNKFGFQKAPTG